MKFRLLLSIVCFSSIILSEGKSQNISSKTYLNSLTSAYGYIEGQLTALKLIGKDVPKYATKAFTLWYSFNTNFGAIRDSIEVFMIKAMGVKLIDSMKENMSETLKSLGSRFTYDEISAQSKIVEVEDALNWKIPSQFLQPILSVKYYHTPYREFLDNHTQLFKTKGHPKSKGSDWQIRIPLSWISSEGERPNIIQKFLPQSENGLVSISILVKSLELPAGMKFSKKEVEEFFTEKEAKGMVPDGGKFLSFKKMVFDGINGGLLISEQEITRLDNRFNIRMHSFFFYWKEQFYYINCSIGSISENSSITLLAEKYMPLFRLVANSIVVNSKYE